MVPAPLAISLGLDVLIGKVRGLPLMILKASPPTLHLQLSTELPWDRPLWENTLPGTVTLNRNSGWHSCAAGQSKGYTVTRTPLHRPV